MARAKPATSPVKQSSGTDIDSIFRKYRLDGARSVHMAIRDVGRKIDEAKDPHILSNRIIVDLGGKPVENPVDAGMLARCLVEQAFNNQHEYDVGHAVSAAMEKATKILKRMPELYLSPLYSDKHVSESTKKANDKRQQALLIYMENLDKKNKEIATILASKMSMTDSAASYYVQQFRKASR